MNYIHFPLHLAQKSGLYYFSVPLTVCKEVLVCYEDVIKVTLIKIGKLWNGQYYKPTQEDTHEFSSFFVVFLCDFLMFAFCEIFIYQHHSFDLRRCGTGWKLKVKHCDVIESCQPLHPALTGIAAWDPIPTFTHTAQTMR